MSLIDPVATAFEDIMACKPDSECARKARQYAAIIVYGAILVVVAIAGYKIYGKYGKKEIVW